MENIILLQRFLCVFFPNISLTKSNEQKSFTAAINCGIKIRARTMQQTAAFKINILSFYFWNELVLISNKTKGFKTTKRRGKNNNVRQQELRPLILFSWSCKHGEFKAIFRQSKKIRCWWEYVKSGVFKPGICLKHRGILFSVVD